MAIDYCMHIIDFRPAPDGWRVLFLDQDENLDIKPMPGWLILGESAHDTTWDLPGTPTGGRMVAAAAEWKGVLEAAHDDDAFVKVLGPGEPVPSREEALTEVKRRRSTT